MKPYLKRYPTWCCYECGMKARKDMGWGKPIGTATFHMDTCNVCGEFKSVTEPRDFNYPEFKGYQE